MRPRRIFAGLLIFLLALTACKSESSGLKSGGRETGARGGRLAVADRSTPRTFNYLLANDRVTLTVCFFLLSARLAELDHDAQQLIPGLAESWQVADEGKKLTVKLREGLKFSDGAPLTADDVLFTLKVIYDEKVNSIFRGALLVGDQPMKVTKVDARTIELRLPQAVAAPENNLYNIGVLPRHKLEAAYERGEYAKMWDTTAAPGDLAVSGPFTLKEYVAGQRTILARNEHYWKKDGAGNQLPYLDELVIEAIPDPNTALLKFERGELDILDEIRPTDYATLKDKPGAATVRDFGPWMQTDFLWFNLSDGADEGGQPFVEPAKRAWFLDARFRRAVAHAIDRQSLIQNVLRGLGTPLHGVVSPSNKRWFNANTPTYSYDLNRAKALLQEAGFQWRGSGGQQQLVDSGGRPVEFTVVVSENVPVRKQMATIIQEDLAKLGMKVHVSALEDKAFTPLIRQGLIYEAAIHGYSPTDTDPSSLTGALKVGGQQRFWFMNQKQPLADWDARLDQLMDEQEVELEAAKRKEKFNEAQRLFAEHVPMVPLVVRHFVTGAKTDLGNYRSSVLPPRSLWNADELFWRKP
jgi:peptide/nickel transport system substrate-binding protein